MRIIITLWSFALALSCGMVTAQQASPLLPANATGPGSITVAPGSITYFARRGETLIAISRRFTGKPDNWLQIGKINQIDNDSNIPIGTGILIPAELLSDDPTQAKVVAMSGTITAKTGDGAAVMLTIGAGITEGMQIDTARNSFLTMSLPDASRVSLPSNSTVRIAKLRVTRYTKSPRTDIMLMQGKVESRVSPLNANKGAFDIRTPQSVAGVRGTHFRVGVLETGVAHEVLEGKVLVGKRGNGDGVMLAMAKGVIINANSVGPATDLLPAPQLVARPHPEYPLAQFMVTPIAGARAYHAQISTDRESLNVLSENLANAPLLKLEGVPDGNYFIRLSAIDHIGLEGLTRTQPVQINAQAEFAKKAVAAAPHVDSSSARDILLRWQPQSAGPFVLQIARDADFSWLLLTSQTAEPQARVPRFGFGTYYARVQSMHADGTAHAFSAGQAFIVTDQWVINDGKPVFANDSRSSAGR